MPKQLTDEEWSYYQNQDRTAQFVESIYNDPRLNKHAKALIKAKYPQLQIPDYDLEQKIDTRFAERDKQVQERRQANRQKQLDEKIAKDRAETQKKYGFTDDAMKKLEDFMLQKNIGDYEVAASYTAAKEPKTSDPTYESHFWQRPDRAEQFKEISSDPEGWARKELAKAARADEVKIKQQSGG